MAIPLDETNNGLNSEKWRTRFMIDKIEISAEQKNNLINRLRIGYMYKVNAIVTNDQKGFSQCTTCVGLC